MLKLHSAFIPTMSRIILCIILFCGMVEIFPAQAQIFKESASGDPLYWKNRKPDAAYWQQDVHYKIEASMDESDNRIDGKESLEYTNNSPDVLQVIYFHLYQNAFIKGSYLHRLEDEKGQHARLGPHEKVGEGTLVTDILVDGKTVSSELDNTILQIKLSHPLQPGSSITISMNFKTWYDNGSSRRRMAMYDAWGFKHYNGCQWYPKVSVYDRKFGWDTYQHLNKEFYGEFGSFDVSLDFPSNYVLEATGVLQNRSEVLPEDLRKKLDVSNFAHKPLGEAPSTITPYVKGERKTWKYHADGVHDFAFTADPSYRLTSTTWNGIECVGIVQEPHAAGWQHTADYVATIVKTFSKDIGPYGYPKMVAADANDGMEYPMLTLDGGIEPGNHGLLVHEIGHNWFYGMVGSNETYRAALDEGFTQFLTSYGLTKIEGDSIPPDHSKSRWVNRHSEGGYVMDRNVLNTYTNDALHRNELPLNTHSNDFHDALAHEGGYREVYFKTASMLYNLQYTLGDSLFQEALHHYFMQWRFAHPYLEDFRASIIQFTHVDLNWFFDEWIETTKTIDYRIASVHKVKGVEDTWSIQMDREGLSQMPVDFTVTAKDGHQQSYTIPNTWFAKSSAYQVLPKWYGWSKINPSYTTQIRVPSGIRSVQIDTTYRLADADWSNNYYTTDFWKAKHGNITCFDAGLSRPLDRRHTRTWIRPDLWWNPVDGVKAGIHIESDYLFFLHKLDASVWWNTHLLQEDRYKASSIEYLYGRFQPVSFTINLSEPFSKNVPKLVGQFSARNLDGLQYLKAGAVYDISSSSQIGLHFLGMSRTNQQDLAYLIYPTEWSSTNDRPNNTANLSFNSNYSYAKGYGSVHLLFRAPFLGGNRTDAFDYSFAQAEWLQVHHLGKLNLHTRFFARYGTGNNLPYESALFAGGANSEQLMENKYIRSIGFVPETDEWQGISRFEPGHFQAGGGLNLRGYNGYFLPDTRDGEPLISYKSRSGISVNAELDFERYIRMSPRLTRNWLHLSSYLFADAGIMELSHYSVYNYTLITPTEMWSDVHVDAGLGFAATIKKFGPFDQARPLTVRIDFPIFLNRPGYNNPEYAAFRYVIGIERAF